VEEKKPEEAAAKPVIPTLSLPSTPSTAPKKTIDLTLNTDKSEE